MLQGHREGRWQANPPKTTTEPTRSVLHIDQLSGSDGDWGSGWNLPEASHVQRDPKHRPGGLQRVPVLPRGRGECRKVQPHLPMDLGVGVGVRDGVGRLQ